MRTVAIGRTGSPSVRPRTSSANSPGTSLAAVERQPDLGTRVVVGHLQMPAGVGVALAAAQRHPMPQQRTICGVVVGGREVDGGRAGRARSHRGLGERRRSTGGNWNWSGTSNFSSRSSCVSTTQASFPSIAPYAIVRRGQLRRHPRAPPGQCVDDALVGALFALELGVAVGPLSALRFRQRAVELLQRGFVWGFGHADGR